MKYQLLIFDWDGTLMDSEAQIIACVEAASKDLNLPQPDKETIRNIIGLGLKEAINTMFPGHSSDICQQIAERYQYHFLTADPASSTLFSGVINMLNDLKKRGYWLAVATGKSRPGLQKVLNDSGLKQTFHATRCAGDTASKPNPQMLYELLDELGIESSQALMIGDTVYDLQMAKIADMPALAVSYGVHERERLLKCNPVGCVDDISALHNWF